MVKRISSISVNIPAAGLGSRPPSIISSVSTDEGGFNEPSPEIKAKLKPAYDFEPKSSPTHHQTQQDQISSKLNANANDEKPSLNYVDVGYRLNPDGSEAREVYGESELYDTAKDEMHKKLHANGFAQETTTVYAIIKPEVPPPSELFYGAKPEMNKETVRVQSPVAAAKGPTAAFGGSGSTSNSSSLAGSPAKMHNNTTPPVGIVSPVRRRNSDLNTAKAIAPPQSPPPQCTAVNIRSSAAVTAASQAIAKGVAPIASLESQEEFETPELPARPPPPPKNVAASTVVSSSPLDLQDLEYADSSAGEDEDDLMLPRTIEGGENIVSAADLVATKLLPNEVQEAEAAAREDSLPDAMTADEAERLLSSR